MRLSKFVCVVAALMACVAVVRPASAVVPVVFGASWDPPAQSLQSIIDTRYGPGTINVQTDFVGAHAGDPDPWFWFGSQFGAMIIREVAGNANRNVVGWYEDKGSPPVIDGVGDGVVFDGPSGEGATAVVFFDRPTTRFGFYLNPNGPLDALWAAEPEKFYTNRLYNERGPNGAALHAPFDGDVQALVFDISNYSFPNTWLVCFEDLDSGSLPTGPGGATDNDFNDFVFEVTALGATPTLHMSLGALKARYHK